jgi:ketosteroid isomerase-like protein
MEVTVTDPGDPPAETPQLATARRLLAALSSGDTSTFVANLSSEVVYESPFYATLPPVRGARAFEAVLEQVAVLFSKVDFTVTNSFAGADPNQVVVECHGDNIVAATGARYRNHYVMLVRFSDGKVVEWREFSNPLIYREAMGTS